MWLIIQVSYASNRELGVSRLLNIDGDDGTWGGILNDFLSVSHAGDGTLNSGVVSNTNIADGTIALGKLATSVQTFLGKADAALPSSSLDSSTAALVSGSSATSTAINSKISTAMAGTNAVYILAPSDPDPTSGSPAGLYFRRTS